MKPTIALRSGHTSSIGGWKTNALTPSRSACATTIRLFPLFPLENQAERSLRLPSSDRCVTIAKTRLRSCRTLAGGYDLSSDGLRGYTLNAQQSSLSGENSYG